MPDRVLPFAVQSAGNSPACGTHNWGPGLFVEKLPEGLAVPQLFRGAAAQRYHPAADSASCASAPSTFEVEKYKLKGLRIAVNEIEDSVPAGVHSRDQIRPRHRALRRDACWSTAGTIPASARRAKFGILPSAMNLVSRSGSRPSTPRMIIFLGRNTLRPAHAIAGDEDG
jgi:hypothetical protein